MGKYIQNNSVLQELFKKKLAGFLYFNGKYSGSRHFIKVGLQHVQPL